MGKPELLIFWDDPRLAAHAISHCPVWVWSADAGGVLWANPTGAAIFNAPTPAALSDRSVAVDSSAALQIARVAGTLTQNTAPRLERLRGFGGRLGGAVLCNCSRVVLADRGPAILVVATEPAGPKLAPDEQARRLLAGYDDALALFTAAGTLLHATKPAEERLGSTTTLDALDATALGERALAAGRASDSRGGRTITLTRLGTGASALLLASFAPQPIEAAGPKDMARPPEPPAIAPSPARAPNAEERRQPLRFVWQMDLDGRFTLESEDFLTLLGPKTRDLLGRPWSEIAASLEADPEGQVVRAVASRDTWSGITVTMPVDGGDSRVAVELSGLPVFDRDRNFRGYRGFGICRDTARARLARARGTVAPSVSAASQPADAEPPGKPPPRIAPPVFREEPSATSAENVVPFRTANEKSPALTAGERKAFSELASRLSARLRGADQARPHAGARKDPLPPLPQPPVAVRRTEPDLRIAAADQRPILDRLAVGVLVYRLDKLLYSNRAFLDWTGYRDLHALEEAGGLDALFVEPGSNTSGDSGDGKVLTIATNRGDQLPVEARLFTTSWDGDSALVLMLANVGSAELSRTVARSEQRDAAAGANEARAILDSVADGIVIFDRDGLMVSINRGAEALFGYQSREMAGLPFVGLFAPDSQAAAIEYLAGLQRTAGAIEAGCELTGRTRAGGTIPLFMKAGWIEDGSGRFCAVLRDTSSWKKTEAELVNAKRRAETASSAKSDFVAKISHEIRTPLNAIIGFAEVMMQERFGPIGNERYKQYLGDIRTSGDYLVSLLNDLLDLSKIEAGKLELNFVTLDLNGLTQQCVALMQPQANRERIIIRMSLAEQLAPVTADARSVRQIVLNLLSNSIKFTGAGGQVIVSTAHNDTGDVVLRVRDTGAGMSEQELAIALEPFRQLATSDRFGSGGTGLGLPLTKAMVEANRASFSIKSAVHNGTLVEIAFPPARQLAAE